MSPLSGVLGEAWTYYKRFAGHFLALAFAIYLVTAIVVALLALAGRPGLYIGAIAEFVGFCLVVAALVRAVQDVRDGRVDLDLRETVSSVLPFLLPVAVAGFLAEIGIGIGLVLFIVPGLILFTFWSLIVPSIVLGGEGIFGSFGRSWRTVRGYAWPVFGTYLLVFLIWVAFRFVLAIIFFAVPLIWREFIASIVSGTLVTPFVALVVTLIYYRLTAAHEARGGPGEAPRPPAGPDATYGGPGARPPARAPRPPARAPHPPARAPHPPAGTTPAEPGTTYPEPGAQPAGPDGTYPRPDVPPAIRAGLGRAGRPARVTGRPP